MKKYILFLLLALAPAAFAQVSTQGTDFYVAFGKGSYAIGELDFQIRIVATEAATVTLTFNANNSTASFPVNAGEVYTYDLTATQRTYVCSDVTGTSNKSLHIHSTAPVSVYALNQHSASTDATNVLPVSNLGTDYYQVSYRPMSGRLDGYTVVATENNTTVYEGGSPMATLNAGQVYSAYYSDVDATGRHITSSAPIAYFVTSSGVQIPHGTSYADILYQQLVPVNAWGNNFLVPVTRRGKERVRIVASQDGTAITQTGGTIQTGLGAASLTLNAGQFVELETTLTGGGCYISADKPVAVASYLIGIEYSGGLTVSKGDPAMAWVPPIEQTIAGTAIAPFAPSGTTQLDEHHALIVTATATRSQTTVAIGSGSAAALSGGSWTAGNGAGSAYSFYSLPLTNTSASYYFYNPNGLTVMGYGLGRAESYYYLSGASARNLDAAFYINEIHYQDVDGQVFCGSQSFAFRAAIQYAMSSTSGYLKWYFNGTEDTSLRDDLEWNKTLTPGVWTIRMDVIDMYNEPHSISTTITIKNYQATAGTITTVGTSIPPGATATLTGASNGVTSPTYRWYASQEAETPLHTGPTYTTPALTTSATYYVSVEGANYCENAPGDRKEVTVTVLSSSSITVNPINDLVNCIGMQIPATTFSSPVNGVTFQWANSNPAIGLAASGTGAQPEFTAAQVGSATITVTPYSGSVAGTPLTYTIKVSPCVLPVNPHLMIRYKE